MAMTPEEKAQRAAERALVKHQLALNQATLNDVYAGASPDALLAHLKMARDHARLLKQTQQRLSSKNGQLGMTLRPFWVDHLLGIAIDHDQSALADALLSQWQPKESGDAIWSAVASDHPQWAVHLLQRTGWDQDEAFCNRMYEHAIRKATPETLAYLLTHLSAVPLREQAERIFSGYPRLSEPDEQRLVSLLDAGMPLSDADHPSGELIAQMIQKGAFALAERLWSTEPLDPYTHFQALQVGLRLAMAERDPIWVPRLLGLLPQTAGASSWVTLRDSLKDATLGMDLIAEQARTLGKEGLRQTWVDLQHDEAWAALDRMAPLVPPLWSQALLDMVGTSVQAQLPQTVAHLRTLTLTQRPASPAPSRHRPRA